MDPGSYLRQFLRDSLWFCTCRFNCISHRRDYSCVLETSESYWIWRRYNLSLFLCSKASTAATTTVDTDNQILPTGAYELTGQDFISKSSLGKRRMCCQENKTCPIASRKQFLETIKGTLLPSAEAEFSVHKIFLFVFLGEWFGRCFVNMFLYTYYIGI